MIPIVIGMVLLGIVIDSGGKFDFTPENTTVERVDNHEHD